MMQDARSDAPERRPLLPVLFDGTAGAVLGVALVRFSPTVDGPCPRPLWIERFEDPGVARARFEWMLARPERWPVWVRTLSIVGADTFPGFFEDEIRRDAVRLVTQRHEADVIGRKASDIILTREPHGHRHSVALWRQDRIEPFLLIVMDEEVERDRVWDWLRWKGDRYERWRTFCKERGQSALVHDVIRGMLRDEKRLRAAGLTISGRRPLRLWRGHEDATGNANDGGF
ncbi:hypothetical protein [Sphingomonas sp. PB4P5]|uniref:hypothetical protein n=1 Tax=Parasphingomonas puruogangriensis TaxID=3096155 RepID=UPI002FC8243B